MQKNTKAKVVNGAYPPINAAYIDTIRLDSIRAMKVTAAQINTLGNLRDIPGVQISGSVETYYHSYNLADEITKSVNQEEQKDTAMSNDLNNQRYHLSNRLYRVNSEKSEELALAYAMHDDAAPRTGQALVDRILAGKYIVREQKKDIYGGDFDDETEYTANRWIDWRDPAVKKDVKGYEAASAKLDKEKIKVQDIITILEPAEGLKALQAFEDYDTSRPN